MVAAAAAAGASVVDDAHDASQSQRSRCESLPESDRACETCRIRYANQRLGGFRRVLLEDAKKQRLLHLTACLG